MTDGHAAGLLRFEILGEVRVLRDGGEVDLGPAKQRAVLAVLLLQAGRPVPTHQIVDAVWGDDPPSNGSNIVQKYVAGLRQRLDPDRAPRTPGELLALTGSGYVLRTTDAVLDTDEFQAAVNRAAAHRAAGHLGEAANTLRAGLATWRGEALAGLSGPVFEAARVRLAESRATAWESWADLELTQGRALTLIPELTLLIAEFPLREGLRALLMLALHQAGRQAEALAVFRDAREYFLDEFGAEPGERMQDAHRRILRGEPISPAPAVPPDVLPDLPPADVIPPPAPYPGPGAPVPIVRPQTRRLSVLEVIFALLAPPLTCGFGGWTFFVYAGIRRRQPKYFVVAGIYAFLFIAAFSCIFIDPTPIDSPDNSTAENIGVFSWMAVTLLASVTGVLVAAWPDEDYRTLTLRDQARQFALFAPDRAREAGIGRPDLAVRFVDDGGLVDLNHVGGYELAAATQLPVHEAFQIVSDRVARGPFRQPDDLVVRGLATAQTVRRLAPRLICIPPAAR